MPYLSERGRRRRLYTNCGQHHFVILRTRNGVQGKECTICNQWLALDYYIRDAGNADGRRNECELCRREYRSRGIKASHLRAEIAAERATPLRLEVPRWPDSNESAANAAQAHYLRRQGEHDTAHVMHEWSVYNLEPQHKPTGYYRQLGDWRP